MSNQFDMTARAEVACDKCEQQTSTQIKEEPGYDGSVIMVFYCDNCNHKYHVATISARGLKLRKDIKAHLSEREDSDRWIRKLEKLQERFQQEVSR